MRQLDAHAPGPAVLLGAHATDDSLRATENFQQLQDELSGTENRIATSRQVYNDTVLSYDNARQQVPTNLIAGAFNFQPREYFELELGADAREPVSVRL